MNKIVLKYLAAENFASFADKVEFTTESDVSKKEFLENTFSCNDMVFNKVNFLYGANGSGKTYFCKILRELQRMFINSPFIAFNERVPNLPIFKGIDESIRKFVFDESYKEKPTTFGVELVIDDIIYHYEFSMFNKKVCHELLTKRYRRTEKLLNRTSPSYKDIELRSDLKQFEDMKYVVKEEALCLPIAAMLNNKLAQKINNAIQDISIVSMAAARIRPKDVEESFSLKRIEKYISILQKADPTLRDIKISVEEAEVSHNKPDRDDFENRDNLIKKTRIGVKPVHAIFKDGQEMEGTPINFFEEESLGTIKLFTVLPYLFEVLEKGGVLFLDEIENGLHLSLAREILELFKNEKTNPNHAQLICTSHQPLLLDGDFRRDQVWIASKDSYGKSHLNRMSELKTSRAKFNLSNKIIEGAFGCNPDKFFNNI